MAKVVVTGGAGFIGSHIVRKFLDLNHEVHVVDNLSTGNASNVDPRAILHVIDINDVESMRDLFNRHRYDWLSHQAAHMELRVSVLDPKSDCITNVIGSLNVITIALDYGIQYCTFASSGGAIYGPYDSEKCGCLLITEDLPLHPISPYGASKQSMENYINMYSRLRGLKSATLRYSNVYGPGQRPDGEAGIVAIFMNAWKNGGTPKIYGSGDQIRDYVYVDDVASAVVACHQKSTIGTFNVSSGIGTSVNDLVAEMRDIIGHNDYPIERVEEKMGDVPWNVISNRALLYATGWYPKMELRDGLKASWEAFNCAHPLQ